MNPRTVIRNRIRYVLAERGVTAKDLASRLGWTQSYLQRRINGRVEFSATDLAAIARELEVPVSYLIPEESAA